MFHSVNNQEESSNSNLIALRLLSSVCVIATLSLHASPIFAEQLQYENREIPLQKVDDRAIGIVVAVEDSGLIRLEGEQPHVWLWGVQKIDVNSLKQLIGVSLYCSEFGNLEVQGVIHATCNLLGRVETSQWFAAEDGASIQHLLIANELAEESCSTTDNAFRTCNIEGR